ncbi:DUF4272 domain-containing protein [Legionella dresdenensis]|uniref:DUF4272 domain-containing protein n=1 Tax=Legionella dresdenensis TaxID=450200 RepID=A0ABV8CCB1_9GAMM
MSEKNSMDLQKVKANSEAFVINAGGKVLDWLPIIEWSEPRPLQDIIERALIINAMYQLHIGAPKQYIAEWLSRNNLSHALSSQEASIFDNPSFNLTDDENFYLYFSLDALWAIAWATNLTNDLSFNEPIGSELAQLSPNLQLNENGDKYIKMMRLRSTIELYSMRDLYYRLHWWLQNEFDNTALVDEQLYFSVLERRKALEWIMDVNSTWDSVDMSL